jgi:hypothetical protein
MESEERSDWGQISRGPSEVADQSCARIMAAASPPLARKLGSARVLSSNLTYIAPLRCNRLYSARHVSQAALFCRGAEIYHLTARPFRGKARAELPFKYLGDGLS